jgi:hypothetical protein
MRLAFSADRGLQHLTQDARVEAEPGMLVAH